MEFGGNNNFLEYLKKSGVISGQSREIDYKSNIVARYKQELNKKVEDYLKS